RAAHTPACWRIPQRAAAGPGRPYATRRTRAPLSPTAAQATVPVCRSSGVESEVREALALAAVGREITRVEPALEGGAQSGPVGVDDGEPGGVAVAPAGDHRLPE